MKHVLELERVGGEGGGLGRRRQVAPGEEHSTWCRGEEALLAARIVIMGALNDIAHSTCGLISLTSYISHTSSACIFVV